MNKHLFSYDFKSNRILILAFSLVLLLYTTIAVGMFDPDDAYMMESLMSMLPEGMVKAFGFEGLGTNMTTYIGGYLYGFIYLIFPSILSVLVGNKIMSKHIDSGSMAYLLTTPLSRTRIALTQAVFHVFSVITVLLVNVSIAIVMAVVLFPGHLEIGPYLMLNVVTLAALTFTSSLIFFFSVFFNEASHAYSFSSAVPVMFFVLNAVRNINDKLDFLKFLTIFAIVDVDRILEGGSYATTTALVVFGISFAIYFAAIRIFDKRSLVL